MKKDTFVQLITGLIAALFFYAAFSKLIDYEKSKGEMLNQIFPETMAIILSWMIPATEIILAFLLCFFYTRKKALLASLFLLSGFTLYIAIVMTGIFGRVPCSCGGILKNMGYGTHLFFNLFFVGLSLIGLGLEKKWKLINRWFYPNKERNLPGIE